MEGERLVHVPVNPAKKGPSNETSRQLGRGAFARRSLRLIELAAAADIILNLVRYVADVLPWWVTVALLLAAWAARLLSQPEKEVADGDKA